jgi:predicted acyl esterase
MWFVCCMNTERAMTAADPKRLEVRIRMDDGVSLAATVYAPDPAKGPQPCVLEALPYRKDDITSSYRPEYTRLRDEFSYVVCRLDLRGTGSSGGDATDEYPAREQKDLADVIGWLAGQSWCDGNVGMYGTSYSGFNSLQMACENPSQLKAIIAIYATDDRYTDDVHYRGGALRFIDLVDYCHYMTPMNALPPVPAVWGDGWRDEWKRRLETVEPWLFRWLSERYDGPYWRHGSVRPDYARIECPVMIVAGWADGYRNNSFRTVEALRSAGVPHRLLAGPWAHAATDTSLPGPRIDLVPEMVAWWDRWLRGRDNGVDSGPVGASGTPAVTCFVRSSTRPEPDLDVSRGDWIREEWPSPRVGIESRELEPRGPYATRPDVGVDAWIDCAGHLPYGQSLDQRFDDAASMTWDWPADEWVLIGHPVARLRVSADAPVAYCSVKLCDVFPDGTSTLVTRGSLDLTHRESHSAPQLLIPDEEYEVEVALDACAYRFDAGQLMRLSLSGADWPNTEAPPGPVRLTIHGGSLELPRWRGPSPYSPPVLAARDQTSEGNIDGIAWRVERDVLRRLTTCVVDHGSTYDIPHAGSATEHYSGRVSVQQRSFQQRAHAETTFTVRWPDATVTTHAVMDLVTSGEAYDVEIRLVAREQGVLVGDRQWSRRFARGLSRSAPD